MASPYMEMPPVNDRGPEVLAICGTFVGLSLATVILRVWVRSVMAKNMGWDDYIISLAMSIMFAEMMVIVPEVKLGGGRNIQYLEPENVAKILHLFFVTQPLCLVGLLLTKLSIGFFLLRIGPSRKSKYLIWGIMVFTFLSTLANLLTLFLECQPLSFQWDLTIPGSCLSGTSRQIAVLFNTSLSILTDGLFTLLPMSVIWNMQLNWRLKLAVAGVLLLGVFASVAAIVKTVMLEVDERRIEFSFGLVEWTIWTNIEICTAIAAACIPCLKPLFQSVLTGTNNKNEDSGDMRDTVEYSGGGNWASGGQEPFGRPGLHSACLPQGTLPELVGSDPSDAHRAELPANEPAASELHADGPTTKLV